MSDPEAPSPTPLTDLAAQLETAIKLHKDAVFLKTQADLKETETRLNRDKLQRQFREAVDAMRPKRTPRKPAVVASINKPNLPA